MATADGDDDDDDDDDEGAPAPARALPPPPPKRARLPPLPPRVPSAPRTAAHAALGEPGFPPAPAPAPAPPAPTPATAPALTAPAQLGWHSRAPSPNLDSLFDVPAGVSEKEASARERAAAAEGQLQAIQSSATVHIQLQSQMLAMAREHTTAQAAIYTAAQNRDAEMRRDDARRNDSGLQNLMTFAAYNTKMYTVGTAMNSAAIAGQHGAVASMAEHATGNAAQFHATLPAPDGTPALAPSLALPPPPPGLAPALPPLLTLPPPPPGLAPAAAAASAATAEPTTTDQKLEKLAGLLSRGLLSQNLHDQKVMALLDADL